MEDYCRSMVFHKIHIFASILKKNGVNWKIRLLRILNRFLLVLIGVCHWCVWPILGLFLVLHA